MKLKERLITEGRGVTGLPQWRHGREVMWEQTSRRENAMAYLCVQLCS